MGVSRTNLHNKLKALTGMSTSLYVRQTRLDKSRELLRDPSLNISEIAYDVGFKSPGFYTRMFREAYGETPTQYRESVS